MTTAPSASCFTNDAEADLRRGCRARPRRRRHRGLPFLAAGWLSRYGRADEDQPPVHERADQPRQGRGRGPEPGCGLLRPRHPRAGPRPTASATRTGCAVHPTAGASPTGSTQWRGKGRWRASDHPDRTAVRGAVKTSQGGEGGSGRRCHRHWFGASGMSAALTAAVGGAEVLVLERTDRLGGTTTYSGGALWIPNNRLMAESGSRTPATTRSRTCAR